jgi:hypothetical protein
MTTTTTNLSNFGFREIKMARDLLSAWVDQGLPDDFVDEEVAIMMNQNSGNVFLTNAEYQVAMLRAEHIESFYTSPYEGREGFFDELVEVYADMHHEDQEWFKDLAESLGRTDELPEDTDE